MCSCSFARVVSIFVFRTWLEFAPQRHNSARGPLQQVARKEAQEERERVAEVRRQREMERLKR